MADKIRTFGIIGGGNFGRLAAERLAPNDSEVLMYDVQPNKVPQCIRSVGMAAVARADAVVLAVPFSSYREVLPELARTAPEDTLMVDVCSVKVYPTQVFKERGLLDRPNVLMTHPLFGPQTARDGVAGKNLVVTDCQGERADDLLDDWQSTKGLNVIKLSADEHDKEMAMVHVLPFLVGRALINTGIRDSDLATGFFKQLRQVAETERGHSMELYDTVQNDNPYAAEIRERFMAVLRNLDGRATGSRAE